MVRIKKRIVGKKIYYYLEHAIRKNGKIRKKEKYIGKQVPKNIELLKKNFFIDIYKEKWYPLVDKIRKNFFKDINRMSKIAKEKEKETFVIKFTYDTQRIEGSKLTLRETADLLEKGITPKAKPIVDVKEAEAHKKILYEILEYKKDLSLQVVLFWHKKLFEDTKLGIAGKIRRHQVAISGSRFVPPFSVELYPLLREFFRWYNKNKNKLHPIELVALVHLKFVTIHPFVDGNGRISRLMTNFVLNNKKYPLLNIPYENRAGYYNALERSQIKKIENIFLQWFFRRYVKEYKRYLGK